MYKLQNIKLILAIIFIAIFSMVFNEAIASGGARVLEWFTDGNLVKLTDTSKTVEVGDLVVTGVCTGCATGSGITSLNGLVADTQTFLFATSSNLSIRINSSGSDHTLTPLLDQAYTFPLVASTTNWQTAFLWGDHSSEGYLTTVSSDADWTDHNSYPTACSAGSVVSGVGDTLTCVDSASFSVFGTVTAGLWNGTAVGATYGGTGLTTVSGGSLLYSTQANTWSALASSTSGTVLSINSNGFPAWVAQSTLTSSKIQSSATLQTGSAGEIGIDTTSNQLRTYGTATTTFVSFQSPTITIASTTLVGATTTIPLGVALQAETWSQFRCYTDTGTAIVQFGDGTNNMIPATASATVGIIGVAANNSFTDNEKRYINIGTVLSAPNYITCIVKKTFDAD